MDGNLTVAALKGRLLKEVGSLFHRNGTAWKEPILDVVHDLRQSQVPAVLFGGTLRSLLVSRVFHGKPGRPRDIDIVVSGTTLSQLEEQFNETVARRTRFGGLKLQRGIWQFDVWPVGETWAFKHAHVSGMADFAALPETTTFNLEAVAVEVWPCSGPRRALYSGNDQFFQGILSRTIELNLADNPFPELTVVRGVIMASETQFKIGPRLATYIGEVGPSLSESAVERIQVAHYGHARMDSHALQDLITMIVRRTRDGESGELPIAGKRRLWVDVGEESPQGGRHRCREAI